MADLDDLDQRLRRIENPSWPLPKAPEPAPESFSGKLLAQQQARARRIIEEAEEWQRTVADIHAQARRDQDERRRRFVASREYRKLTNAIDSDDVELARLDAERAEIMSALYAVDAKRRPVIERLEAARQAEAQFTEATMPIPDLPPHPNELRASASPFKAHGMVSDRWGRMVPDA